MVLHHTYYHSLVYVANFHMASDDMELQLVLLLYAIVKEEENKSLTK